MALTKENVAQLVRLQEQDKFLDGLKASLDKIPADIQAIEKFLEAEKAKLGEAKAKAGRLQLAKKDKESQLQQKEEAARKHGEELNKVKTNEAYKALLLEIEKAKADASELETAILLIMEELDQAARDEKTAAAMIKEDEAKKLQEIEVLKAKEAELKSRFDQEQSKRDGMTPGIPEDASKQYDYLRRRKPDGEALAKIRGSSCGACRIALPPQAIVEVAKNRLVTCESCQRILYSEEPLVEQAKTA